MCNCRVFCRWLPVAFVVVLIAWCYFVFTFDILQPLLSDSAPDIGTPALGVMYTIFFNIVFGVGLISFVRAVFADPGRVPDSWIVGSKDVMEGQFLPQLQTLEVKHDGTRRVCRKSKPNVYKPDRAHFCKMLGRCVLKMDHFCPWLNNCIGFGNHKYFYLFIFYMATLTVFMIVAMTPVFVHDVSANDASKIDFTQEFRVTLTYLVLCLLSVGLVCFWSFHTYLLMLNYTTIEFLEKRGCSPPPDHINRYNVGMWGNVASVLGDSVFEWLLPTRCTVDGDGLSFKLNPEWYPGAKMR